MVGVRSWEIRHDLSCQSNRGGKLVIPAVLRRELGIMDGDSVIVGRGADGGLSINTHAQVIAAGQRAYQAMLRRPFTVDEFIADRRREAGQE